MGFIDEIKAKAKANVQRQSFFRRQRTQEPMKQQRQF